MGLGAGCTLGDQAAAPACGSQAASLQAGGKPSCKRGAQGDGSRPETAEAALALPPLTWLVTGGLVTGGGCPVAHTLERGGEARFWGEPLAGQGSPSLFSGVLHLIPETRFVK